MERNSFNGPLIWSTICIAAVVLMVLLAIPPLAEAAFGPNVDVKSTENRVAALIETHAAARDTYTARFDGRSIFFKPKPPRAVPRPVINRDPTPTRDPEPVREVRRTRPPYSGPSVKGYVGSLVFFDDALTVAVGEEVDGIEVLSVDDAPKSIKVKYSGWEYDLDFASGIPADFFGRQTPARSRMPGLTTIEAKDDSDEADGGAGKQAGDDSNTDASARRRPVRGSRAGRNVAVPVAPAGSTREAEEISRPAEVDDSPPPR